MDALPPEIIAKILISTDDARAVVDLASTCKGLRRTVVSHKDLLTAIPHNEPARFLSRCERFGASQCCRVRSVLEAQEGSLDVDETWSDTLTMESKRPGYFVVNPGFGTAMTRINVKSTSHVRLDIASSCVLFLDAFALDLFKDDDGSLDLTRFLGHVPASQYYNVLIFGDPTLEVEVTLSMCRPRPCSWNIDQIQTLVEPVHAVEGRQRVRLPFELIGEAIFVAVEHHGVRIPCIQEIALYADNGPGSGTLAAVSGRACWTPKGCYRVPLGRHIDFSRLEGATLLLTYEFEVPMESQIRIAYVHSNRMHSGDAGVIGACFWTPGHAGRPTC